MDETMKNMFNWHFWILKKPQSIQNSISKEEKNFWGENELEESLAHFA